MLPHALVVATTVITVPPLGRPEPGLAPEDVAQAVSASTPADVAVTAPTTKRRRARRGPRAIKPLVIASPPGLSALQCGAGSDRRDVADEPGPAGAGVDRVGDIDDANRQPAREGGWHEPCEAGSDPVRLLQLYPQRLGVAADVGRGHAHRRPQPVVEQRRTGGPTVVAAARAPQRLYCLGEFVLADVGQA